MPSIRGLSGGRHGKSKTGMRGPRIFGSAQGLREYLKALSRIRNYPTLFSDRSQHHFQTGHSTELLNVENKRRAQCLVTIGLLVSSTPRRISLQRASMGRKITLQNPQNIACVSPLKRESSLMQIHTGLLSIVGFVSLLAAAQAASSFD